MKEKSTTQSIRTLLGTSLTALALTVTPRAQAALELVADINLTSSPAVSGTMTEMNGFAYFAGYDGLHGWELWRSDGTVDGTALVKDIFPGDSSLGSLVRTQLVNVNGTLFFKARTAANGVELWKSDGTEAGTVLVRDILPGSQDSNPGNLTSVNGTLFFTANDGVNGTELWKSDGTEAGTVLVRDISLAAGVSSSPAVLTDVNGTLFFRANDGVNGVELWKSDGTEAGTLLVKNINATAAASSNPSGLVNNNGTLFFSAGDGVVGTELWKSDGTQAGTVLVKNINTTSLSASSSPSGLAIVNGTLFFSAADGVVGAELWKSDGTEAGTVLVKDINTTTANAASSFPSQLIDVNGTLYFLADSGLNGTELWKSDGTEAGTVFVKDIDTTSPTASSFPSLFVNVNGMLFFSATDATNGTELWMSDGTETGTVLVRDILPGLASSSPSAPIYLNGSLLFSANDGVNGVELWTSDGTTAGTTMVKDINTVGTNSGGLVSLVEANGTLYYSANDGVLGTELWKTDLTTLQTGIVKDVNPGAANGIVNSLGLVLSPLVGVPAANTISVNGQMFFVASDPVNGTALWTTDGTEAGTRMVKDINPSTMTGENIFFNLVDFNGTLFFAANDGVGGADLWKSDGTEAGTVMVKNFGSGGVNGAQRIATGIFNNNLYFAASDAINGSELWKSDGTEAGTVMVKNINPGVAGSAPSRYIVVNGTLYFVAGTAANGSELWKTDGTEGGTVLVKDIRPGTAGSMFGVLQGDPWLTEFNGTLYFTANDGVNGPELWKSDGTTAGTSLVKDIRPGNIGSFPPAPVFLTLTSGGLFFFADNGVNGYEPWISDGTAAGTSLLVDILPGISSSQPFVSSPSGPASVTLVPGVLNGAVYFSANDGVNGAEVWKSDGTVAGTVRVSSHVPADFSSAGSIFKNINGTLYFSSIDLVHGFELWRINEGPTAHAGGPYTVAEGNSIVLDGTLSSDLNQPADSLIYAWDLDGDGLFGESGADALYGDEIGATPTFSAAFFENAATLTVQLRVTDNGAKGGLVDTVSTSIEITSVNDAPTIVCPADVTLECAPPAGFSVDIGATVSDVDHGQTLTVTLMEGMTLLGSKIVSSPATDALVTFSAVTLLPGEHMLTVVVSDGQGGMATCNTTVTIELDTALPVVGAPSDLTVLATGPTGAVVSFATPTATDCAPANPVVTCAPGSGSLFAIGDTLVVCSAIDAAGNLGKSSFTVHVKGATEQLNDLLALVNGLTLAENVKRELAHELEEALKAQARGRLNKVCDELEKFVKKVDKHTARKIPAGVAATLLAEAARIQAVLGCD